MQSRHNRLPVRPGMDVYDRYQSVFIGSVVKVVPARPAVSLNSHPVASTPENGSAPEATLEHEQGARTSTLEHVGRSSTLGEDLGPFPTASAGNSGPRRQSAAEAYATNPAHPDAPIAWLLVRPRRINLGILTPPLYVPGSAIEALTLERVILNVRGDRLPPSWRVRPQGF